MSGVGGPKGNQWWKARSSHGRKPKFATAEELEAACDEYFQWVEDNPLWEDKLVTFQGDIKHEPVPHMRAMTLDGLCLFLGITNTSWQNWRKREEEFAEAVRRAENVIRTQKFAGAAAELLNPNLIMRDLGMAEKSEHTGKDGEPLNLAPTIIFSGAPRIALAPEAVGSLVESGD